MNKNRLQYSKLESLADYIPPESFLKRVIQTNRKIAVIIDKILLGFELDESNDL